MQFDLSNLKVTGYHEYMPDDADEAWSIAATLDGDDCGSFYCINSDAYYDALTSITRRIAPKFLAQSDIPETQNYDCTKYSDYETLYDAVGEIVDASLDSAPLTLED